MKTNLIEHQIVQLLRDGHTEQQIAAAMDLPEAQIKVICKHYSESLKRNQLKASNQHNQAIYAMNLQG